MIKQVIVNEMTPAQFAHLRQLLEAPRKKTRPRKHDLYDVFCAILHFLHAGCAWRGLPPELPPWRTVNEYFSQWTTFRHGDCSLLEHVLERAGRTSELVRLRELLASRRAIYLAERKQ